MFISLIYFFSSIVLIRDAIINDEQTTLIGFLKESKHASYHDELDSVWTRIDKENV